MRSKQHYSCSQSEYYTRLHCTTNSRPLSSQITVGNIRVQSTVFWASIKQVGVAVMHQTCIRTAPGSNLGPVTGNVTEILHGFLQSLQTNSGPVPKLGNKCFLSHPSQIIVHRSSYHSTLHHLGSSESVVKQSENQ